MFVQISDLQLRWSEKSESPESWSRRSTMEGPSSSLLRTDPLDWSDPPV